MAASIRRRHPDCEEAPVGAWTGHMHNGAHVSIGLRFSFSAPVSGFSRCVRSYSLVNFRAGVTRRFLVGELFMRNAFDTRYIPLAFPYPNFAPSGFMGEMGAPRTIGVSIGARF
jgi:hypothetical protein